MVDSVAVFDPGVRISDGAGNPLVGGSISFFSAGTSDALTVYSDGDLTVSLGAVVYTDADGAPVSASGSSTKVPVFLGSTDYKIVLKDGAGNVIESKDSLKGAVDTSLFDDGSVAIAKFPVVSSSSDYTVLAADRGKIINRDPTGGDVTLTLLSAVTAGDGWAVTLRHIGTANKLIIQTVSSQTILLPLAGGAAEAFEMVSYGESITITSDGSNWHVIGQVLGNKLGGGYHAEIYDHGTKASGTLTCYPEESNFQKVINNGAFTLAVPTENTSIVLQVTNGSASGLVTTSGFTKVSGDSITTSTGDDFFFNLTVVNGFSRLLVEALQ
jgi:hypothetical protein